VSLVGLENLDIRLKITKNNVQGGAIGAILDGVCTMHAVSLVGNPCPTAFLNIQYKKEVKQYTLYLVVTTCKKEDRKMLFTGTMYDINKTVFATCETLSVVPKGEYSKL